MLASGAVRPLQSLVYDFAAISTALRQFSAARHVGKIVVRVSPALAAVSGGDAGRGAGAAQPLEAWAVTGGLGALGTITAEWLAGQGVRHIHLLGRTGRWSRQPSGLPPYSVARSKNRMSSLLKLPCCDKVGMHTHTGLCATALHQ